MNAELRRFAWLELSAQRLVLAPVVILTVAAALSWRDFTTSSSDAPGLFLAICAMVVYGAVMMAQGVTAAANAFSREVAESTWDFQRLSALSARELTLGKLFGGPIYLWYVGGWLLLLYAVGALRTGSPLAAVAVDIGLLISAAVLVHGLALMMALATGTKRGARRGTQLLAVGALLAFLFGFWNLLSTSPEAMDDSVSWWTLELSARGFALLTLVTFACWSVLGGYRGMKEQLLEPMWPLVWPTFLVFVTLYLAGIGTSGHNLRDTLWLLPLLSFGICLVGMNLALIKGPTDPDIVARWFYLARHGTRRRLFEVTPLWLVNLAELILALGLFMLSSILFFMGSDIGFDFGLVRPDPFAQGTSPEIRAATLIVYGPLLTLLVIRETIVRLWLTTAGKPERSLGAWILYMVLVNAVLPALLASGGGTAGTWAATLLNPMFSASSESVQGWFLGYAIAAVEVVVLGWVWHRRSSRSAALATPASTTGHAAV